MRGMKIVLALLLITSQVFSQTVTVNTGAIVDSVAFSAQCISTPWTTNAACFNVKYAGWQCCAGTANVLGISVTTCMPQATSGTSGSVSAGVTGVATYTYACSAISIKALFGLLVLVFMSMLWEEQKISKESRQDSTRRLYDT